MEIELTETRCYSFEVGGQKLEGFVVASEWNGMTELRRPGGDKVIVYGMAATSVSGFMDGFGGILGDILSDRIGKVKEPKAACIISASPAILDLIAATKAPKAPAK